MQQGYDQRTYEDCAMTNDKPHANKHDQDAARRAGKGPLPNDDKDKTHKETQKGSGEGVTGMQRGAGHPTGR
jgi:hypothetical protein